MITFNIINKNIAGSVNGKPFTVPYSQALWDDMVKAEQDYQEAKTAAAAKQILEKFTELTQKSTFASAIEDITPYVKYKTSSGTYHLYSPKQDKISDVALPEIVVDKMKYAHDENLPTEPFVKLMVRALRNPNIVEGNAQSAENFLTQLCKYVNKTFVSENLLEEFIEQGFKESIAKEMATVYQTPITMEGLISTKKVVSPLYDRQRYKFVMDPETGTPKKVLRDGVKEIDEDTGETTWNDPDFAEDWVFEPAVVGQRYDAFLCGHGEDATKGHIIKVGKEMALESWNQVDCNHGHRCSKGLHTGNQDYIRYYERDDTFTVNCFVDPSQIGAIPYNDHEGVIRCKRMFIESIKDRNIDNRNLYNSSTYAALNDEIWEEYIDEVIDRFEDSKREAIEQIDESAPKVGW